MGARWLRLWRATPAGLPGAVRRPRNHRKGGRGRQRLFEANQKDGPGSTETRSLAAALCKFLMATTAFLSLEDISDNLPVLDESVISVYVDPALQQAYEQLEEDIRSAMKAHLGNKSLMSILLNMLLLYRDHPYDFDGIWERAFDPQMKEYVKFLVTEPENLIREALYAKERALIAKVKEELRQGRRCQVDATYAGEKDITLRLEAVLRQEVVRVAVLRSSVATDKREDWYDRQLKAALMG